jgi:hypothetical protein
MSLLLLQLQHALAKDEQKIISIYKVDQLTTMCWCKATQNQICNAIIANCYRHTCFISDASISNVVKARVCENAIDQEL